MPPSPLSTPRSASPTPIRVPSIPAPALGLVDQSGASVGLETLAGKTVLVSFAFAHCVTVCPVLIGTLHAAVEGIPPAATAVVVITLDPWRDTPGNLPAIAQALRLERLPDARVLSGEVEQVNAVLAAWGAGRQPRRGDRRDQPSRPDLRSRCALPDRFPLPEPAAQLADRCRRPVAARAGMKSSAGTAAHDPARPCKRCRLRRAAAARLLRFATARAPARPHLRLEVDPFYQSGNLAVLAFLVCLASGLVLFLWYHIADPHGSVRAIQESLPGGAWLRSLHRYSADLAVVAIAAHTVRKLLQGHTWGPRALAWISGVVLLLVTLFSGWTGLVMVWDVQGQGIAIAGARLLDLLPIFSEPISRSFSGEVPPASSFFFMALFLHVALPLGLGGAPLWLHVSRISRPALLPPRPMIRFLLAALATAALLAPLDLPPAADLLALPGSCRPTSSSLSGCRSHALSPGAQAALWLGLLGMLAAAPGGGARGAPSPSPRSTRATAPAVPTAIRTAPDEAIAMVPRSDLSQSSAWLARVDPERCVGCGICAASCAPMGVGPAERDGRDQLVAARAYLERYRLKAPAGPTGREVVLVACRNGALAQLGAQPGTLAIPGVELYPTGCSGSVHTSVIELLVRRGIGGVFVLSCLLRNCYFREGPKPARGAPRARTRRRAASAGRPPTGWRSRASRRPRPRRFAPPCRPSSARSPSSRRPPRSSPRSRPSARRPRCRCCRRGRRGRKGRNCRRCSRYRVADLRVVTLFHLALQLVVALGILLGARLGSLAAGGAGEGPPSGSRSARPRGRSRSAATPPRQSSRSSRSTCGSPASAKSSRWPIV